MATSNANTRKPERTVLLAPQPGPQTLLLTCPIGDVLFGGARGGGKTLACILDWISHMTRHGKNAKGVWFRRSQPEIEDAQSRMLAYFPAIGATYAVQPRTWTFANGAVLKLRYLESDQDATRYQGHENCVAIGTPVLMADDSWKPIEAVQIGDMVATLEGPRQVTAKTAPYLAPCVRAIVRDAAGAFVGEQQQPVWHPILTPRGCFPTVENVVGAHRLAMPTSAQLYALSAHSPQTALQRQRDLGAPHRQGAESRHGAAPTIRGWCAFSEGDQTDCTASSHDTQETPQPLSLTVPVVLLSRALRSSLEPDHAAPEQCRALCKCCSSLKCLCQEMQPGSSDRLLPPGCAQSKPDLDAPCPPNASCCAQTDWPQALDCLDDCRHSHDCGGEHAPALSKTDQSSIQAPVDAATPCRGLPLDAMGTIPKHIPCRQESWVHPYTGEARNLLESIEVGSCEMSPCGNVMVADITVDGANHYVTRSALINKNTWLCLDDMGTWKSPAPIDMLRATLRSAAGVPARMLATANPGGVGHAWIKARYVDPAPPLTPFVGADGQQRVFIPSRLTDNRKLLDSDPTYIDRLKASGPAWLVKAWLDGDWDASQEGAVIKREWLGYTYDALPAPEAQRKERAKLIVSVDCAASMGSAADYTAIVVALHCGHHVYVRHVRRGKWEFPALAAQVQQVCEQYAPQIVLIENKSNGLALIPYLKKQAAWKWGIVPVEPKGTKAERLYAQTHWLEAGRVLLPQAADWLAGFIGELLGFDDTSAAKKGQNDDQVDALTQLLQYCSKGGYQLPDW